VPSEGILDDRGRRGEHSAVFQRHDRYLPLQLMNQGDRLALSNRILVLRAFAILLLAAFSGDTHALIPLSMIGGDHDDHWSFS
jgi:hypothetical protein